MIQKEIFGIKETIVDNYALILMSPQTSKFEKLAKEK